MSCSAPGREPALHDNLASTCERLGRLAEAVDHFEQYLAVAPPPERPQLRRRISALRTASPRPPG